VSPRAEDSKELTALLSKRTYNYFEFLTGFKIRVLCHHKRLLDPKGLVPDIIASSSAAIDCGRLLPEFFMMDGSHSFHQIIRDEFFWFMVSSFEAPESYAILEMFVGLAGFNRNFRPIRFAKGLDKRLLHIPLTVADVA
jgi:hypothetical protein